MAIVKDLGMVTAYAYAVAGGYEGTEAEFTELLGQAGVTLEQLENLSAVAVTLSPSSEATASYSDGVLTFGIPQGATGETGQTGPQGPEGPTGNGIVSIAKTGTSGLVDTYTITFTDGTTTAFTVTNGADGDITNVAEAFDATKAYSVGDMVLYQGTLYAFTVAHPAGAWVGSDAQAVILSDVVADLKSDFEEQQYKFNELAEKGYYVEPGQTHYIEVSYGMIVSNGIVDYPGENTAYAWLTAEQKQHEINFDNTISKVNVCYMNNGSVTTYTSWITESPLILASDIEYDTVGINVRKLSGNYTAADLETVLSYTTTDSNVGKLATIDMIPIIGKGLKQIYPDGFSSRIQPDIYLNGLFNADINLDDYKIPGSSVVWIATNGNDSTGNGSEENPYLTLTKALTTDAATIKIKAGTYTQGTHYTTSEIISGKNIIGIGNVIFQNDAAGHYITTSGNVYVENIIFRQGTTPANNAVLAVASDDSQCACFYKCVFSNGKNGIGVLGIDAVMYECIAFGNMFDGFNYHASSGRIPNVIEINCVAYNNGSAESASNSCNGSTTHDGTKIIRLNGEYYSCYGGVIADASTSDDETTKSVNFGCIAHTSTGASQYNASFWATFNTEMYLYDCKCYGSTYDISAFYDAIIVSRRLTTGRNVPSIYANASATVLQY